QLTQIFGHHNRDSTRVRTYGFRFPRSHHWPLPRLRLFLVVFLDDKTSEFMTSMELEAPSESSTPSSVNAIRSGSS
ncbi:hypothetical protein Csa_011516, partial [Cucumis sativus]